MQGLIDHGYDGNQSWLMCGLVSLGLLLYSVSWVRSKRKSGQEVDRFKLTTACLLFLAFSIVAVFEILLHPIRHK